MFQIFPRWKIIQPTLFYNGRKFSREPKRSLGTKSKAKPKNNSQNQEPIDQSKDIQGDGYMRGGARGRGRPSGRNSRWHNEYNDWDRDQSSGSRSYRSQQEWDDESWSDRSQRDHGEYYDDTQEREGYYTKKYDSRKRSRR